VIEVIAILALLMVTAVVSFGVGSAVGYKAGKKVAQFHAVKRGVEVIAPIARQIVGEFTATRHTPSSDWITESTLDRIIVSNEYD